MDSYRSILEVLRWSSPRDVLLSAAHLSLKWTAPADSQELWTSFCEDAFVNMSGCNSAKEAFRICPGILSPLVPALQTDRIRVISLPEMAARPGILVKNIGISVNTSYCFIDICNILCCGPEKNAVKVNLMTEEITKLPEMMVERARAGMLKHRDKIYVLGGLAACSLLRSIEKFSLKENCWTQVIKGLNEGRCAFTPCKYKEKAFLVGSCQPIELFNMKKEEYKTLILNLPFWITWSLCGVVEDVLIVVLPHKGLRWKIHSADTSFQHFNFPIVKSDADTDLVDVEHTFNGVLHQSSTDLTFMTYNWVNCQAKLITMTPED